MNAVVAFLVILVIIVAAATVDGIRSHHGVLTSVLIAVLFSVIAFLLIYSSYVSATRMLTRVAEADEARLSAEEKLKEVSENEHVLLNAPVASAVLIEMDGTVLAINETGARLLGTTPGELVGKSILDMLPGELAKVREDLRKRLQENRAPVVFTAGIGDRLYTLYIEPIMNDEGEVVRTAVFSVDVTDQADMHRRLKESEARYRTQFETSVDGIVFSDMSGVILDCNEAYAQMLGYEVDELIGADVWSLTPREWQQVDRDIIDNQLIPTGRSDTYEKQYRRKDGSLVPVSLRVWMVLDEEGKPTGSWGRVEDLSEKKQYEDFIRQTIIRLEQANDRLREIDRLKTEFVGMVSHELRAPIAAVESGFNALRALGDNATEEQRVELLDLVERGTRRLGHLVDDLLDITRIESGQLRLELQEVDAVELIGRVTDLFTMRYEEKGVELALVHSNGVSCVVCDPGRVEQMLTNLIDNALKFTEEGSVTVRLDTTRAKLMCSVTDTGPGIPPEQHLLVFEKFHTTGPSAGMEGVGLGLAISQGIVEAHGGRMWVESHKGSGATFGFELPLSPTQ